MNGARQSVPMNDLGSSGMPGPSTKTSYEKARERTDERPLD